jgi:hypothetical protein
MAVRFKQGRYTPVNPQKYLCKTDIREIFYRSSWERRCMIFFDQNPTIKWWNSEGMIIPYYLELDKKHHRYFVDFIVCFQRKDQPDEICLIEVKPYAETIPPKMPKTKTKKAVDRFVTQMQTYEKNQAKWKAAREYAKMKGVNFIVLTEHDILPKKTTK